MALHWPGDPTMNINMSVWEARRGSLGQFVFQTVGATTLYASLFFEAPDRPEP